MKETTEIYENFFKEKPKYRIVSPGRIDLMGIHTDYNEGFVLAAAIDRATEACASPRSDGKVILYSENIGAASVFLTDNIEKAEKDSRWSNYFRGVYKFLIEEGYEVGGANIAVNGNIPTGSGLSSSASIELAMGTVAKALNNLDVTAEKLALIGRRSENEFVGVQTGIMDQFACALGKKDNALFIDCRTLGYELAPLDMNEVKIVVFNTAKQRGLVGSEYDTRRKQCEEGAAILGVKALRDIDPETFERRKGELPEVVRKRVEHVVYENDRTVRSVEVLRKRDFAEFGKLMNAGHDSARDLYEVSCPELEAMVEISRAQEGVLSARLAGAGFGGCTVSIIEKDAVDKVIPVIKKAYRERTGLKPESYICNASEGAHFTEI
ncbi:MAG: galactokinase [Abditibacteriota bacterium]|nr:galactokinase [Abditibacteriota bacterium]MBP5737749.1 galactokinase [Abditibacteriota bacterium]